MLNITTLSPLGLYIHLPWCARKCPYCDFNSHALKTEGPPEREYVDALLRDLEPELPLVWGRQVETVFIGGGTPSLVSAESLDRLFSGLRALLNLKPEIEITLEANPGAVERGRFAEYRALGINRISVGVQSFDAGCLERLGRIHDPRDAARAIEAVTDAGFDDFNLDLMFGLPGQTAAMAQNDLQQALAFSPPHLSWYQLTLEPNTLFAAQPPALPDADTIGAIHDAGIERLAAAGLVQYEVSAFSRPGRECLHNLNYWQFGDYLGIGAGAHGKLTLAGEERILRRARKRHPEEFMRLAGTQEAFTETTVAERDLPFEFMLNALRLRAGFPVPLFLERTGLPISQIRDVLGEAESDGLIEWDITRIRPSETGWRYLNDLLQRFLP
ncbi:MAG: radical SAM family heme chaperone HemW [Halothiobacillaceae bacterium]